MGINIGYPSTWQTNNQLKTTEAGRTQQNDNSSSGLDFSSILIQKSSQSCELSFSKHANERLQSRNIDLSKEQLDRLNDGAKLAQEKGIKESLVMMDDMAFIVNIPNNTVVTALGDADNKVITNIDGAVIV